MGNNTPNTKPAVKETGGLKAECFPDSITLSWKEVENAGPDVYYQVYYKDNGNPDNPWDLEDAEAPGKHTIANLKTGQEFAIFVRAFNDDGLICSYPVDDEYLLAKTGTVDEEVPPAEDIPIIEEPEGIYVEDPVIEVKDTQAPKVTGLSRRITDRQLDSLTIAWNKAEDNDTPQDELRYDVLLEPYAGGSEPKLFSDVKGYSFTFKDLKPETDYRMTVFAYDRSGNPCQYTPLVATTLKPVADLPRPVSEEKTLYVSAVDTDGLGFNWKKIAGDDIRYDCCIREVGARAWTQVASKCTDMGGMYSGGLKPGTEYVFYVEITDKAGTVLRYEECTAWTKLKKDDPVRINRLPVVIEQNATVLNGTNSVSLTLTYNYVKFDASGQVAGRQTGTWDYKWSNKKGTSKVFTLPANWYFENNRVHVVVKTRVTAVSNWKTNSEGDVDISGGSLTLKLSGHYLKNSVKFTQVK